jgi:hypothetical protein
MLGLEYSRNFEGYIWVSCFWKRVLALVGAPKGKMKFCRWIWV